jgi:hypothetical protein
MSRLALPPETQHLHDKILAEATPQLLQVARILQRAAFYNESRPNLEGDFHPALVYLFQAHAFLSASELFSELLEAAAPF